MTKHIFQLKIRWLFEANAKIDMRDTYRESPPHPSLAIFSNFAENPRDQLILLEVTFETVYI